VASACVGQVVTGQNSIAGTVAPEFSTTATDGKTYTLSAMEKKPTILVFWKNPCPHNPRASSLVNSVVDAYKGKVSVLGVVNSEGDTAKSFQEQFGKDYPFLHDAKKSIITSYKQPRSIVFVVIDKDRKVESVIGGYSQESMALLNTAMAKAAGMEEAKLDFSGAPTRTTYG
jgi:peroxiredoxin